MQVGLDRDLQLGADAVGSGDQHGVLEAGRPGIEQAAKAADLGVGAGPCGGAHQGLDHVDQTVSGIDVDAGIGIGEAVALGHANSRSSCRSLRRIWAGCNGSRDLSKHTM